MTATIAQPMAAASLAIHRRRPLGFGSSMYVQSQWPNTPILYPAASDSPESTPCVTKFRGSSVGVRAAAKNSVPRRRPPVENKRHSPLPITRHLCFRVNISRQVVASGLLAQAADGAYYEAAVAPGNMRYPHPFQNGDSAQTTH